MADQFKISQSVTFSKQTPPETANLIPTINFIVEDPLSYESGQQTLGASASDVLIASNVTTFVLFVTETGKNVELKIGSAAATPVTTNLFTLSTDTPTDIYISNPSATSSVSIVYASCQSS